LLKLISKRLKAERHQYAMGVHHSGLSGGCGFAAGGFGSGFGHCGGGGGGFPPVGEGGGGEAGSCF
jgi:hypothetical protein